MGRKGWGGVPPADDDEARKRIIDAAIQIIERRSPTRLSLGDVADRVGISRPTLYRYFSGADTLLAAVAEVALAGWTARISELTADITDPAQVLVEAVAYQVEQLPGEPLLAMLIDSDRTGVISRQWIHPTAIERSRIMLEHGSVDWSAIGFDETALDDLVEFVLRIIQSMVSVPRDPPRTGVELRDYLHRHIAPIVSAPPGARRAPG